MSKNTHTLTLAERIDTLIDDPEVNPEQVGQRLRLARRRAGFSQQELADALNVGRRTIYEWEIGERIPKKHLTRISQVLAVSRARLLTGRDDYYAELSELREMLAKSEAELAELRRQVRLTLILRKPSNRALGLFVNWSRNGSQGEKRRGRGSDRVRVLPNSLG